jgi:hypothetical protein
MGHRLAESFLGSRDEGNLKPYCPCGFAPEAREECGRRNAFDGKVGHAFHLHDVRWLHKKRTSLGSPP